MTNQIKTDVVTKMIICRSWETVHQSIGVGLCFNEKNDLIYQFRTLELPWLFNKIKRSRISVGTYDCIKWVSGTKGNCFKILSVQGRKDILIHKGNYNFNTEGCVLVGSELLDINKDGLTDVINSGSTLKHLLNISADKILLIVK